MDLGKISTRRLLKMRDRYYPLLQVRKYYAEQYGQHWLDIEIDGVKFNDIKAELAKREHVPNKTESKEHRKAKIAKRNRRGRRNR